MCVNLLLALSGIALFHYAHAQNVRMTVDGGREHQEGQYSVLVGVKSSVRCTVRSAKYDAADLVLKPEVQGASNLDNRTIQFDLNTSTKSSNMYRCCIRTCRPINDLDSNNSYPVTVDIGYLPSKPTNFSCYSPLLEQLMCSWNLLSRGSGNITWNVTFKRESYNQLVEGECTAPVLKNGRYTCTIHSMLSYSNYTITVGVQNYYGQVKVSCSVYTDYSIAVYSRQKKVFLKRSGSRWLEVGWNRIDEDQLVGTYTYRLTVLQEGTTLQEIYTNLTSSNVSGLTPYTTYTFVIQTKVTNIVTKKTSSFWNEPSDESNIVTDEDKPSCPPLFNPAVYYTNDNGTALMFFWKPVPVQCRNGRIVSYHLVMYDADTMEQVSNIILNNNGVTSYTDVRPDVNRPYVVNITASTSVGDSRPNSLRIAGFEETKSLTIDYVIVEQIEQYSYNVTWLTSNKIRANVTVIWTFENISDITHVDWKQYKDYQTYAIVNLPTSANVEQILYFGASLTSGDVTGGITWNKCIFRHMTKKDSINTDASPPKPTVKSTPDYLKVFWLVNYCSTKVKPISYIASYHPKEQHRNCSCQQGTSVSVPAEPSLSNLTLHNLTRSVDYCICTRIQTTDGMTQYSPPIIARLADPTRPGAPELESVTTGQLVGGVIGGVIFAAVIIGFAFVVCKVRKTKPLRVEVPRIDADYSYVDVNLGTDVGSIDAGYPVLNNQNHPGSKGRETDHKRSNTQGEKMDDADDRSSHIEKGSRNSKKQEKESIHASLSVSKYVTMSEQIDQSSAESSPGVVATTLVTCDAKMEENASAYILGPVNGYSDLDRPCPQLEQTEIPMVVQSSHGHLSDYINNNSEPGMISDILRQRSASVAHIELNDLRNHVSKFDGSGEEEPSPPSSITHSYVRTCNTNNLDKFAVSFSSSSGSSYSKFANPDFKESDQVIISEKVASGSAGLAEGHAKATGDSSTPDFIQKGTVRDDLGRPMMNGAAGCQQTANAYCGSMRDTCFTMSHTSEGCRGTTINGIAETSQTEKRTEYTRLTMSKNREGCPSPENCDEVQNQTCPQMTKVWVDCISVPMKGTDIAMSRTSQNAEGSKETTDFVDSVNSMNNMKETEYTQFTVSTVPKESLRAVSASSVESKHIQNSMQTTDYLRSTACKYADDCLQATICNPKEVGDGNFEKCQETVCSSPSDYIPVSMAGTCFPSSRLPSDANTNPETVDSSESDHGQDTILGLNVLNDFVNQNDMPLVERFTDSSLLASSNALQDRTGHARYQDCEEIEASEDMGSNTSTAFSLQTPASSTDTTREALYLGRNCTRSDYEDTEI